MNERAKRNIAVVPGSAALDAFRNEIANDWASASGRAPRSCRVPWRRRRHMVSEIELAGRA